MQVKLDFIEKKFHCHGRTINIYHEHLYSELQG